ncbi:zinc finger protein 600-like [Amyelois transitella]|uniref:zinc finger protein 600-like n=1 Tax=Amyelois transitella TaxID=680683 RepID=UPI00067C1648|nr:zinc finger protein 600-like [Amyelois transitella]
MDEPEIDYMDTDTTCGICFAEFLDLEDLNIHKSQVHITGILTCQFCDRKQRSIEDYAIHIRDSHLLNLNMCQYCSRAFVDLNYCKKHEKTHIVSPNATQYACSRCERQFINIVELEKHEFDEHKDGDSTNGVLLHDCLPHLSSVINMRFNLLKDAKNKLKCSACSSTFLHLDDYIQHLSWQNCRSLSCNSCHNVYKNKKSLIRHLSGRVACDNSTRNVEKMCGECFKAFPIHIWKTHCKNCKAIKCHKCGIVFEKLDDLSKHQIEKHPLAISVLVCKYCQRECVGKVALDKHIERSHDVSMYKYKCVYCDMVFMHPKKLFAHFVTKHKDIEPYCCNICDKKFRIRKNFTIHIKMVHNSVGSVEFDEKFHVYFKEKKVEIQKDGAADGNTDKTTENECTAETSTEHEKSLEETENTSKSDNALVAMEVASKPMNYDFMATETEAPTEDEANESGKKTKRKTKSTRAEETLEDFGSDSSDDQPLLQIRKNIRRRARPRKIQKVKKHISNKERFTCKYCNKSCSTFQNYHQHMNSAHPNVRVSCVKCGRKFPSRVKLSAHIAKEHSSSKLTETLKNILAKRKKFNTNTLSNQSSYIEDNLTITEKFQRTIKKVDCDTHEEPAILKASSKGSVQNFIENFTPESIEAKKNIEIESNIMIKTLNCPPKPPFIKLTKFQPKATINSTSRTKLAMPVRFKPDYSERQNVTVKVVNVESRRLFTEPYRNEDAYYDNDNDIYDHYEEMVTDERLDQIPDVAQEVMLEGTEMRTQPTVRKIVLPNVPKELDQIRIATLLPEAPYYKILKISDVVKTPNKKKETKVEKKEKEIVLPNGKKLVSVNPLAHLLGDTSVEKLIENMKGSKYYQPKTVDFEKAVAKALMNNKPKQKKKPSTVEP